MIAQGRHARLSFEALETIFGVMFLVLNLVLFVCVTSHFFVVMSPSLRARFKPTLLGHIAFLAILWLAIGGVMKMCNKQFPYLH